MMQKRLNTAVERVAGIEPASQAWKAREVTVFCGKLRAILRPIPRTYPDSLVNKAADYRRFTAHETGRKQRLHAAPALHSEG